MPKLCMWFYNPQSDASGIVNKLVSRLDPPYCHCELQFQDGAACSIYMGSKVALKTRTFSSTHYDAVVLECEKPAYDRMRQTAQALADREVGFSTLRMTASLVWLPTALPEDTTFCSELCADVLQSGGLLVPSLDTAKVTPSGLHRLVSERQALVPAAPPQPTRSVAIGFRV